MHFSPSQQLGRHFLCTSHAPATRHRPVPTNFIVPTLIVMVTSLRVHQNSCRAHCSVTTPQSPPSPSLSPLLTPATPSSEQNVFSVTLSRCPPSPRSSCGSRRPPSDDPPDEFIFSRCVTHVLRGKKTAEQKHIPPLVDQTTNFLADLITNLMLQDRRCVGAVGMKIAHSFPHLDLQEFSKK